MFKVSHFSWYLELVTFILSELSATKPKLVAKILATNSVTFVHGLPKLAANLISQSQRLVNTVLVASSLVKWISIKVGHPSKMDKVLVVYCSLVGIGSIWVIMLKTLSPVEFYTQRRGALQQTCWSSYFKELVCPLEVNFLEKLLQLVALQIFQSSYPGHDESQHHNILSDYH